jgi:hypothetical protein
VPGTSKFDAKSMTWESLKKDGTGYEPFATNDGKPESAGFCPSPKDGKGPIPNLPLPPK